MVFFVFGWVGALVGRCSFGMGIIANYAGSLFIAVFLLPESGFCSSLNLPSQSRPRELSLQIESSFVSGTFLKKLAHHR